MGNTGIFKQRITVGEEAQLGLCLPKAASSLLLAHVKVYTATKQEMNGKPF